jgi:hypothetical protein
MRARMCRDHRHVLAAQPLQLERLLGQVALAHLEDALGLGPQRGHAGIDGQPQHGLALAEHALAQQGLERGQAAGLEQPRVAMHLGLQSLLRRHRQHLRERHVEVLGGDLALLLDLLLDLRVGAQRVPQGVDLVEHHEARVAALVLGHQVLAPDRQVGAGDAGFGAEDEDHRMRLRDQAHRQFGLGADRVETRGVEDHQPLLEQRMRHVQHGMAPARDLDAALGVLHRVVVGRFLVPEAQRARLVLRDPAHLGHLGHGLGQPLGIADVDRDLGPARGLVAPVGERMRLQAGFDRQQAQLGRQRGVVAELGRTHGGAAGARRHDAPPVAGEEDRVDQLRLAARELGHEGHHDLAGADLRFEPAQPLGHRLVEQLVLGQPAGQPLQAVGEVAPPRTVLVELLVEGAAQGGNVKTFLQI